MKLESAANAHRVCGMCRKTVIQIRDVNGKIQNTADIYIDAWGGAKDTSARNA